jgi:hypothetical protein
VVAVGVTKYCRERQTGEQTDRQSDRQRDRERARERQRKRQRDREGAPLVFVHVYETLNPKP